MVRSAYHLYFRYCRNIARCPSLGMEFNEVDQANKEQFKAHVKRVLEANQDEISVDETVGRPKYLGSDSFTGMSKKLGQEWKEADALTQSVFKDLAKEENDRVKINVFESYRAFTKSLPVPVLGAEQGSRDDRHPSNRLQVKGKAIVDKNPGNEGTKHLIKTPIIQPHTAWRSINHIKEVDMTDEEIMDMIVHIWSIAPSANLNRSVHLSIEDKASQSEQSDLCEFLSGIVWD